MLQFLAQYTKQSRFAPTLLTIATLAVLASASLRMYADTQFFSGNLRTDATVLDCGSGCTLDSSNSDFDYAQSAAVVDAWASPPRRQCRQSRIATAGGPA